MRTVWPLCILASLTLLSACGDDEGSETTAEASEAAEPQSGEEDGGALPSEQPPPIKPTSSITGLDRFKHGASRHAFLNTPTIDADVISDQELIVATRDAHCCVIADGGLNWELNKAHDDVRRCTG